MEIWKTIVNFSNYKISNLGKIKDDKDRILETNIKKGYNVIQLRENSKKGLFRINQLVAKYFLNPSCDKFHVIYKNGNHLDDRATNLKIKELILRKEIVVNNPKTINEVIDELNLDKSKTWKFIKNTNYVISNDGKIFNVINKQELEQHINKSEYSYVNFNSFCHYIHILLVKTFLEVDESKYFTVGHKDGNKRNNTINNLIIKYKKEKEIKTLQDFTLDNEIWKPINNYDNFMISNLGRIINTDIMAIKILKPNKTGYVNANLCENKKKKTYRVHRLVASAFIKKIKGKNIVNHKNGIKHDNRADNLEWVTSSENIKHAVETGLLKPHFIRTHADQNEIENEIWKNVTLADYSHYQVSNLGRIKNTNDNFILNPSKTEYCAVLLHNNDKKNTRVVHRLVALAFIPNSNPNKYKIVKHKNGIKTDNRVENLEWTTYKRNTIHAYETGLIKPRTSKVNQLDLDGKLIKQWSSIKEASDELKISNSTIAKICKGYKNLKICGGFRWTYAS